MEVTVAADVVVDLATRDDLHHHHQRLEKLLEKPHGRRFALSGSGTTGAGFTGSGPIAIGFTPFSPPAGRLWFVESVAVWIGTNPVAGISTANLFAALMRGNCPTGPGAPPRAITPSVSDIVVPGQNVPSGLEIPGKITVTHAEQLYVLLGGSGLAASTVYNLAADVIETPDVPEAYFW